jgi:hypothetical protein
MDDCKYKILVTLVFIMVMPQMIVQVIVLQ